MSSADVRPTTHTKIAMTRNAFLLGFHAFELSLVTNADRQTNTWTCTVIGTEAQNKLDEMLGVGWSCWEEEGGGTTHVATQVGTDTYPVKIKFVEEALVNYVRTSHEASTREKESVDISALYFSFTIFDKQHQRSITNVAT
jgi:hypothetical protein